MEQSRTARARSFQLDRRKQLLKKIPVSDEKSTNSAVIYADESKQRIDVSSIIFCQEPIVEGCLRTICSLVDKANRLINEAADLYFSPFLLYAEAAKLHGTDECFAMQSMTQFLDHISATYHYLSDIFSLFRNILQQLRVFREMGEIAKSVEFLKVWQICGDLLAIFVQIDEISKSRPAIRRNFHVSLRGVESAIQNPTQFATDSSSLEKTIRSLREFDRFVLSGNAMRTVYEQTLGELDDSDKFAKEMHVTLIEMFQKWEKSAAEDQPDKRQLLSFTALAVYYHHHFANFADKKLVSTIFNSYKKIASFHLFGDIVFVPTEFLLREIADSSIFDKKSLVSAKKIRENLTSSSVTDGMLTEAHSQAAEVEKWVEEVRRKLREHEVAVEKSNIAKICLEISELFLKGVRIADIITRLLKTLLKFYSNAAKIHKKSAFMIFETIVAVKTISFIFEENWNCFSEAIALSSQQWRCHAIQIIEMARNSLKSRNINEAEQKTRDSALCVSRDAFLSTSSKSRILISRISLEFAGIDTILKTVDRQQLAGLISRIDNLSAPRCLASKVTNCSFLVHNKSLIAIYWETVLERKPEIEEIRKWCSAIGDCAEIWIKAKHEEKIEKKRAEINEYLAVIRKAFLAPICCQIENDLRILTHPHLNVDSHHRINMDESIYLQKILNQLKTLRIFDRVIDIKEFVTRYLEKTFYNLTIVALHDAQTYTKMGNLAKKKYGIEVISGDLPKSGIEECCDIFEITRNFSSFVLKYNYSMSHQLFIEKQTPNRKLHIVQRADLIKSLRKFGIGILPTSLNVAYQVLCRRLNAFYQMLSDDHIRAQLQLDIQNYENANMKFYPIEMAEKFSRRQFVRSTCQIESSSASVMSGMTNDDEKAASFIDKLRVLITQIGNALGFVRMMTLGAKMVHEESGRNWTPEVQRLIDELILNEDNDERIAHLKKYLEVVNGKKYNDFAQLLVNVFKSAFAKKDDNKSDEKEKEEKNVKHLKLFYIIVPALTHSQAEYMMTCRNRLTRSITIDNAKELTFTNDGFSVGIAYLLTILNIWEDFDRLKWFNSTFETIKNEILKATNAAKTSQGAQLKTTRLEEMKIEYKQIFHTIFSAKVFFIDDDRNNEESEEEEEER